MTMRIEPRWVAPAIAGVALIAASCGLWEAVAPDGPPPRPFNHAAHVERGLECLDCHAGAVEAADAGMPSREACMECHDEIDADPARPREGTVAWFLDEAGNPAWSGFTRQSAEIRFSHAEHAKAGVACAACHAGLETDAGLVPAGHRRRMSDCTACHEASAPEYAGCDACHESVTTAWAPPTHDPHWTRGHGPASLAAGAGRTADDCSLCHRKESCAECHRTTEPADHTEVWRMRSHGLAATFDRERCRTCHTSDQCVRCHESTAPLSHAAGWNAPADRHCSSCHLPLHASGGCAVCHRETPGHSLAPPMPAWHTPALNCRACHAASLGHPDNGDNCNACHR